MKKINKLINNNLDYEIKPINDYKKIQKNLFYYNNYFSITLIERVGNLNEYSKKISENAFNFEIINKNNERLGMISFYANDTVTNTAFITLIVVDKKSFNKGIGSKLIKFAEEYCKKNNMKRIKLEVLKDNYNALKFYEKHKYNITEEKTKSYYMTKEL